MPARARALILPVFGLTVFLALVFGQESLADRVDVEIEGVSGPLERNLKAVLSIEAASKESNLTASRIRRLHDRAPGEIELALQPFGYYRPAIESELNPKKSGDRWTARYRVAPGEPVLVASLDLELRGDGATDPATSRVFETFPLARGDVLEHSRYESAKSALAFAAADRGYFDAAFDSSVIFVDPDAARADIVLHYDTGPRYRFGPVILDQEILDPRVIEGYVRFEPGDPFEVEKLLVLQSGLSESPYFSRVEARPRPDLAEDLEVPIEVQLTPRETQRYEVGVGYGTDTGPRGTFAAEFRRLNQRGHRAQLDLTVSGIEQSTSGRYIMPSLYPKTAVYTLYAGFARFDPTTSRSNKWVIGGSVGFLRWGWEETLALSFEREDFEVGVDEGTSNLFIPSLGLTRTRADDRIFPTRGSRWRFDLKGSHDAVLASATFLQLRGDMKYIRSLGERTRLIARAAAGRTFTSEFRELPPTLRFFAGGDQSVRGYKYQALGPVDEAGNVIGGEIVVIGSAELEYRFFEKWGIAAFYDAGNALDPSSSFVLEKGTGAGLRWLSPIGLVRVDGAYAVGTRNLVRLHVAIGPDL